jgi:hypothetical protein
MLLSIRAGLAVCICSFLQVNTAALGPQLLSLSVTFGQDNNADPVYLRLHKGQSVTEVRQHWEGHVLTSTSKISDKPKSNLHSY